MPNKRIEQARGKLGASMSGGARCSCAPRSVTFERGVKTAVIVALLVAGLSLVAGGCGESAQSSGDGRETVLQVGVSPWGIITADGESVSLSELDARLGELKDAGGVVWLGSGGRLLYATADPYGNPYPKKWQAKAERVVQQVVAMIEARDLAVRFSNMPVSGSASPESSAHSDP